ncbi:MAG: sigma-70 family RNA polymerase sigma factor [Candidatus Omnitrophica bacterium]|nr:sigma-70 family RNA polymerase sigma factor [Candidatus Omnitrophota bacterium]
MQLDTETKSLLVSAKLGKEEALNLLFARYQPRILRIVRLRLTGDMRNKLKLQSMDIVQEVFIYALQHLKDFEPKSQGHFLNWLAKKVEHYIYDRLDYVSRDKRKAEGGEISIDQKVKAGNGTVQMQIQIKDDGTTPSQFAVKQEREQLIDSLLGLLNEQEREVIINRDLEEMTFAEIGGLTDKSEEAVRKQYNRAFMKLVDLSEKQLKPIIIEESYRQYKDGI